MTLEEYLQSFANILEEERTANWKKGDILLEAIVRYGKDVLGKFAEISYYSEKTLKIYASISSAFPKESRYSDVPWSIYRAVYFKARKLNMDPSELLELALHNNWTARDIARYKAEPEMREITRRCEVCDISITIRGKLKDGLVIHCPICGKDIGTVFMDEHAF